MRFWDSSALVALCVREPNTRHVRALIDRDNDIVVWCLSRTEIFSALCRRAREGDLTEDGLETARLVRDEWLATAVLVRDVAAVVQRADRLLRLHPLRAADALQLAAALLVFETTVESHEFVTFDRRLATAARRQGFLTPLEATEIGARDPGEP